MEKMIKMMIMTIACVAMCGTVAAAPTGAMGRQAGRPHGVRQTVNPAPKGAQKAAKAQPVRNNRPAPQVTQHKMPVRQPVAHHAPAPQRHEPGHRDYCHKHKRHTCHDCRHNIGPGLIGGIVGGILATLS